MCVCVCVHVCVCVSVCVSPRPPFFVKSWSILDKHLVPVSLMSKECAAGKEQPPPPAASLYPDPEEVVVTDLRNIVLDFSAADTPGGGVR